MVVSGESPEHVLETLKKDIYYSSGEVVRVFIADTCAVRALHDLAELLF